MYLLGCHFVLFVLRSGFFVYCRPAMDRHDNGDSVLPRCHDWSASRFACNRNLASGLSWHYLDSVQKDTQRATIFGWVGRLSEPTLQSAQTILDQRFCTEAFVSLRQILWRFVLSWPTWLLCTFRISQKNTLQRGIKIPCQAGLRRCILYSLVYVKCLEMCGDSSSRNLDHLHKPQCETGLIRPLGSCRCTDVTIHTLMDGKRQRKIAIKSILANKILKRLFDKLLGKNKLSNKWHESLCQGFFPNGEELMIRLESYPKSTWISVQKGRHLNTDKLACDISRADMLMIP